MDLDPEEILRTRYILSTFILKKPVERWGTMALFMELKSVDKLLIAQMLVGKAMVPPKMYDCIVYLMGTILNAPISIVCASCIFTSIIDATQDTLLAPNSIILLSRCGEIGSLKQKGNRKLKLGKSLAYVFYQQIKREMATNKVTSTTTVRIEGPEPADDISVGQTSSHRKFSTDTEDEMCSISVKNATEEDHTSAIAIDDNGNLASLSRRPTNVDEDLQYLPEFQDQFDEWPDRASTPVLPSTCAEANITTNERSAFTEENSNTNSSTYSPNCTDSDDTVIYFEEDTEVTDAAILEQLEGTSDNVAIEHSNPVVQTTETSRETSEVHDEPDIHINQEKHVVQSEEGISPNSDFYARGDKSSKCVPPSLASLVLSNIKNAVCLTDVYSTIEREHSHSRKISFYAEANADQSKVRLCGNYNIDACNSIPCTRPKLLRSLSDTCIDFHHMEGITMDRNYEAKAEHDKNYPPCEAEGVIVCEEAEFDGNKSTSSNALSSASVDCAEETNLHKRTIEVLPTKKSHGHDIAGTFLETPSHLPSDTMSRNRKLSNSVPPQQDCTVMCEEGKDLRADVSQPIVTANCSAMNIDSVLVERESFLSHCEHGECQVEIHATLLQCQSTNAVHTEKCTVDDSSTVSDEDIEVTAFIMRQPHVESESDAHSDTDIEGSVYSANDDHPQCMGKSVDRNISPMFSDPELSSNESHSANRCDENSTGTSLLDTFMNIDVAAVVSAFITQTDSSSASTTEHAFDSCNIASPTEMEHATVCNDKSSLICNDNSTHCDRREISRDTRTSELPMDTAVCHDESSMDSTMVDAKLKLISMTESDVERDYGESEMDGMQSTITKTHCRVSNIRPTKPSVMDEDMAASLSLLALSNTACVEDNSLIQHCQEHCAECNGNGLQHQVVGGMTHELSNSVPLTDNSVHSVAFESTSCDRTAERNEANVNGMLIITKANDITSEVSLPLKYVDCKISCCMDKLQLLPTPASFLSFAFVQNIENSTARNRNAENYEREAKDAEGYRVPMKSTFTGYVTQHSKNSVQRMEEEDTVAENNNVLDQQKPVSGTESPTVMQNTEVNEMNIVSKHYDSVSSFSDAEPYVDSEMEEQVTEQTTASLHGESVGGSELWNVVANGQLSQVEVASQSNQTVENVSDDDKSGHSDGDPLILGEGISLVAGADKDSIPSFLHPLLRSRYTSAEESGNEEPTMKKRHYPWKSVFDTDSEFKEPLIIVQKKLRSRCVNVHKKKILMRVAGKNVSRERQ